MKEAVKFFAIVYAVFIGIILIFYYFGSFLRTILTGEVIVVLHYAFILFAVLYLRFQKPVRKNRIWIRVRKFNWNFLVLSFPFGLWKLYNVYKDPDDDLLFGIVNEDCTLGIAFILIGLIGSFIFPVYYYRQ
jgi:hypothetical protein